MPKGLHIFGLVHLAILGMVPIFAAALAALQRAVPVWGKGIRYSLAFLLLMSTVLYYGSFVVSGARMFPDHMPLELCDLSLWLVIAALLTRRPGVFDLAYYWGAAGASMALLTPNLLEPSLFSSVQFFADHGLIVAAVLYLVWSKQARPRPGSAVRAWLTLNVVAAFVGGFDFLFKTDFMFLRAKPPTVSLLDVFGPWPWYIVVCEGAGIVLFVLLYLPFRREGARAETQESSELLLRAGS